MRKLFLLIFAMASLSMAAGGDTLQWSTDVESLDDGDTFFVSKHWSPLIDTVQSIINGRLGNVNLATDATIKMSKIDSTVDDASDWIHYYTKAWQVVNGSNRELRSPGGMTVFVNNTNANDLSFIVVSDSTDTIAIFNETGITFKYDVAIDDTLNVDYIDTVNTDDLNTITATITTATIDSASINKFGTFGVDSFHVVNAMTMPDGGSIAIGGEDPASALIKSVFYDPASAGVFSQYGNLTTGITATDGFLFGFDADERVRFYNYENSLMSFATNSTTRLTIGSDGHVGVGAYTSTDPGYLLTINTPTLEMGIVDADSLSTTGDGEIDINIDGNLFYANVQKTSGSPVYSGTVTCDSVTFGDQVLGTYLSGSVLGYVPADDFTVSDTELVYYEKIGKTVTVKFNSSGTAFSGTSNSTSLQILPLTAWPAAIVSGAAQISTVVTNNAKAVPGVVQAPSSTGGPFVFWACSADTTANEMTNAGFTSGGAKGVPLGTCATYLIP